MVKAELIYNPYLLETEVRFNGNPPRINSLVEKYQNDKLQVWIKKVPSIFYDEMNGFDFELDFSGTKLDFEELTNSFKNAGVGKDRVRLFHKGELENRQEKAVRIENLLKWLDDTPNRKFDVKTFRNANKELFEGAYPFIIINGEICKDNPFESLVVSTENVESVDELRKTDLHSTPILFYLDRKSIGSLQNNLLQLLKRSDIVQEQLFFMISPALKSKVKRVIMDLGVKKPQLVSSIDDAKIFRYIELFPVSEYIYDSIKTFREQTNELNKILEEENRQSEITNRDIHKIIKDLDETLSRLKSSYELFTSKENLEYPSELTSAKAELIAEINHWKIKKTKITKIEEATALSSEFDSEINLQFKHFQYLVEQCYSETCSSILSQCNEWYESALYGGPYSVNDIVPISLSEYVIPSIASALMDLKEEKYVIPKEDFFGKFFKITPDDITPEAVLETTFYYEKWRSHAVSVVDPVAEKLSLETYSLLCEYFRKLTDHYTEKIDALIQEVTAKKEQVSSQLSEDERLLQADNDWLTTFCDKLHDIERS